MYLLANLIEAEEGDETVGVVGELSTLAIGFVAVGIPAGVPACEGGISYFCNCNKYASAVGTVPHVTSNVLVLARTN